MSNSDNIFNNSLQEKDAKDKFNKNPEDKDKDISNFINQENKEELSNIDKGIQNNLNSHDSQYRTININLPITDDELILLFSLWQFLIFIERILCYEACF